MGNIDDELLKRQINDYLIELDAVKRYMETTLKLELPDHISFQNCLHNGVYLALLSKELTKKDRTPQSQICDIYDVTQEIYDSRGIQYRHIDNIVIFTELLKSVELPIIFHPDVTDIFEKKNIPKLVYCVRALMNFLNKSVSMTKNCEFSDDLIASMANELEGHDLSVMPSMNFHTVTKKISNKTSTKTLPDNQEPDFIVALDMSLVNRDYNRFCNVMRQIGANYRFTGFYLEEGNRLYFEEFLLARARKQSALNLDEIELILSTQSQVILVTVCVRERNMNALLTALSYDDALHSMVDPDNVEKYVDALENAVKIKFVNKIFNYYLTHVDIIDIIMDVNAIVNEDNSLLIRNEASRTIQKWWRKIRRMRKVPVPTVESIINKIIKIQAIWRGYLVRKAFSELGGSPSFRAIKRIRGVLQSNLASYAKELQLQILKSQIVQQIQYGKSVTTALEELDLQIGLLIQNRATVQELFVGPQKKAECGVLVDEKLKALNTASRKTLEAYQQFFYVLQTKPIYFAVLLNNIQPGNQIMQDIVLSFFNYGSTSREEYFLIKILAMSLRTEVSEKFHDIQDIILTKSAVIKTFVTYAKQGVKLQQLKEIFYPIINNVLNETDELLLYPLEIFKKLDTTAQGSIRHPSNDREAMQIASVRKQLSQNVVKVQSHLKEFSQKLIESVAALPYGIKYFYRELYGCLVAEFNVPKRNILKVIGHSLFYHILNPIIICPEMNGIIDLCVEKPVLPRQRRNLATMAKMLQNIVLNRGFCQETNYLRGMNDFVGNMNMCLMKFLTAFIQCQDLEQEFKMSHYSEAILISPPQVTVTLQVISKIRLSLLENNSKFFSSDFELITKILEDIGVFLTAEELLQTKLFKSLGIRNVDQQFRMTCVNKIETNLQDDNHMQKLFLSAKELCVFLLPYITGRTLLQALLLETSNELSEEFTQNLQRMGNQCENVLQRNNISISTLCQAKRRLKNMLAKLEFQRYISKEDGYQAILSAIAQDILQRKNFRVMQTRELYNVTRVISIITKQNANLDEQLKVYGNYLESCLKNQAVGHKTFHGRPAKLSLNLINKKSVKYTAQRLFEKKVLVAVNDIPDSYLHKIVIEIVPEKRAGYFLIIGKFMNLHTEKVSLDIRHLLCLQYQNIDEFDVFQNAKVNVQGLIFLINKKFYGKSDCTFNF